VFHWCALQSCNLGTGVWPLLHLSRSYIRGKVTPAAPTRLQSLILHPLSLQISGAYSATTTITAPPSGGQQNGGEKFEKSSHHWGADVRPELKDDLYDPTYQDDEGPPPKLEYVWRNIILMALLHLGALYGITLVPSCKLYTCLFGEQHPLSWANTSDFSLIFKEVASGL
jgi:hypothetical protein